MSMTLGLTDHLGRLVNHSDYRGELFRQFKQAESKSGAFYYKPKLYMLQNEVKRRCLLGAMDEPKRLKTMDEVAQWLCQHPIYVGDHNNPDGNFLLNELLRFVQHLTERIEQRRADPQTTTRRTRQQAQAAATAVAAEQQQQQQQQHPNSNVPDDGVAAAANESVLPPSNNHTDGNDDDGGGSWRTDNNNAVAYADPHHLERPLAAIRDSSQTGDGRLKRPLSELYAENADYDNVLHQKMPARPVAPRIDLNEAELPYNNPEDDTGVARLPRGNSATTTTTVGAAATARPSHPSRLAVLKKEKLELEVKVALFATNKGIWLDKLYEALARRENAKTSDSNLESAMQLVQVCLDALSALDKSYKEWNTRLRQIEFALSMGRSAAG